MSRTISTLAVAISNAKQARAVSGQILAKNQEDCPSTLKYGQGRFLTGDFTGVIFLPRTVTRRIKDESAKIALVEEGRKRVLAIAASTRSSSARAHIAEGTRLYALAGRPSKADFIRVYGPKGPVGRAEPADAATFTIQEGQLDWGLAAYRTLRLKYLPGPCEEPLHTSRQFRSLGVEEQRGRLGSKSAQPGLRDRSPIRSTVFQAR